MLAPPDQVAVSVGYAGEHGLALGDPVTVSIAGEINQLLTVVYVLLVRAITPTRPPRRTRPRPRP